MSNPRDAQSLTRDLRGVLNEVLAQPGWQAGNAISLFFTQSGVRTAEAFESGHARSASLVVSYIDPQGLGESLAASAPEVRVFEDGNGNGLGSVELSFRWPIAEAAAAFGLSYEIEVSADLDSWSLAEPSGVVSGGIGSDGFQTLAVSIDPQLFAGQSEFYFRLRVFQSPADP